MGHGNCTNARDKRPTGCEHGFCSSALFSLASQTLMTKKTECDLIVGETKSVFRWLCHSVEH